MTEIVKSLKLSVCVDGKNIMFCKADPRFPDEVTVVTIKRKQLKEIYKTVKADKIINHMKKQSVDISF